MLIDEVFNQKYGKDAKNKMEWIGTVKGQAETFLKSTQWERAIDNVEQARTLLDDALNVERFDPIQFSANFLSILPFLRLFFNLVQTNWRMSCKKAMTEGGMVLNGSTPTNSK
jgi:hypothetical protein